MDKTQLKNIIDPIMKKHGIKYSIKKACAGFSYAGWTITIQKSKFDFLKSYIETAQRKLQQLQNFPDYQDCFIALQNERQLKQQIENAEMHNENLSSNNDYDSFKDPLGHYFGYVTNWLSKEQNNFIKELQNQLSQYQKQVGECPDYGSYHNFVYDIRLSEKYQIIN